MTRVRSEAVLYIGWNAWGMPLQLVPVGANLICLKPFDGLAVIEPDLWLVRSLICAFTPWGVSWMDSARRSPEFMKRSCLAFGVNVFRVESSGFAGACATPFR